MRRVISNLSMPLILCVTSVIVVSGCSSTTPVQTAAPVTVNEPVELPVVETSLNAQQMLTEAQQAYAFDRDENARNIRLLNVAEQYYQEADCQSSLIVLHSIRNWQSSIAQTIHRNLLLAECAPSDQLDASERLSLLTYPSPQQNLNERQLRVRAKIHASQQQFIPAAAQLAQLNTASLEDNHQIWHWVNAADVKNQQDASAQYPELRTWLSVAATLRRYGNQPQQIAQFYRRFVAQNPQHYLTLNTPVEITEGILAVSNRPRNIVVVLPLTGRLNAQGNAIKQGLLSAYFDALQNTRLRDAYPPLQFIDSATFDFEQPSELLLQADLVIGPLVKTNIEKIQPLLSPQTVLLALNRVDAVAEQNQQMLPEQHDGVTTQVDATPDHSDVDQPLQPEAFRFYFALAPEDEAQQLAKHIFDQGYRSPVLVHAQDATSQRLSAAFLARWRVLNQQADNRGITVVSYDSTDAMREGVGSALDVAQSRERIEALERLLGPQLYNVPRNRRDVDAIVAFAAPEQIELLNPIIESSLSPFTNKNVPVYVTSRSIRFDVSKNQLRDLQNVHFLDMPWMMPSHAWTSLAQQVDQVYPNQRDPIKRLFALGYDAYQQLQYLPYMAAVPQYSVLAMSGKLYINERNEVVRELPLAIIDEQQVRVLATP